jgi:hypothetical protein
MQSGVLVSFMKILQTVTHILRVGMNCVGSQHLAFLFAVLCLYTEGRQKSFFNHKIIIIIRQSETFIITRVHL